MREGHGVYVMRWEDDGERMIVLTLKPDSLRLTYGVDGAPINRDVPLFTTRCHFGGSRFWFGCPSCRRRVGRLFLASSYFLCRHCCHIRYASQREGLEERGMRKIRKAYRALGLDPEEAQYLENLPKPPRMHWTTFGKYWNKLEEGQSMRDTGFVLAMGRLSKRFGLQ